MAAADCSGRRRFAVACGVLSHCVRAEAAAGKIMAPAPAHASARPAVPAAAPTMLLMPGADVAPDVREESESALPAGGAAQAQLTIMYGGRVLVFDDVPADMAAELMCVAAAAQDVPGGLADMPVARKMSLQRFMEKRRDRRSARWRHTPLPARRRAAATKKGNNEKEADAGCCWLGLSTSQGCGC